MPLFRSQCTENIHSIRGYDPDYAVQVFLGQKYGYRPIPTIIPANEYGLMYGVIKENAHDTALLDTWFKKDENTTPPVYILQPISTVYEHFNNKVNPVSYVMHFLNKTSAQAHRSFACLFVPRNIQISLDSTVL